MIETNEEIVCCMQNIVFDKSVLLYFIQWFIHFRYTRISTVMKQLEEMNLKPLTTLLHLTALVLRTESIVNGNVVL